MIILSFYSDFSSSIYFLGRDLLLIICCCNVLEIYQLPSGEEGQFPASYIDHWLLRFSCCTMLKGLIIDVLIIDYFSSVFFFLMRHYGSAVPKWHARVRLTDQNPNCVPLPNFQFELDCRGWGQAWAWILKPHEFGLGSGLHFWCPSLT